MIAQSPIISGSAGLIFTIFAPNDRYLFVDDRSGPLFPIPLGTLPWHPILGKIDKMTFIRQTGIPKRAQQFRFKNIQWQYFCYILCKHDQDWSSNPRDCYRVTTETAKIGIFHQISRQLLDRSSADFQHK